MSLPMKRSFSSEGGSPSKRDWKLRLSLRSRSGHSVDALRGRRCASLRSAANAARPGDDSGRSTPTTAAPRSSSSPADTPAPKKSNWEVIEHFSSSRSRARSPTAVESEGGEKTEKTLPLCPGGRPNVEVQPLLNEARLMLKKNAVPSRFPWNEATYDLLHQKRKERQRRCFDRDTRKKENIEKTNQNISHMLSFDCAEVEIISERKDNTTPNDIGVQCDLCECHTNLPNGSKIPHQCSKRPTKKNQFLMENMMDITNSAEVQFFTGFQCFDHFKFVFNLFGDEVNHLKYYPHMKTVKEHALSPCDEFLMTVIKLRRNTLFTELAFRFKINKALLSYIFITWINYLYCKFKDLNVWAPKHLIDKNMRYTGKINPCTIIIDCTEIKIEKPKNPLTQQLTYSTYKACNTLKVLVGISASGCITFVSDAFGGSISDRELFEKCGLIDKLQPNDIILSDRGFNVQDLVCHKDVSVNIPEFLKNTEGQFDTDQLRTSKTISSDRIHVERLIGFTKTFKILSGKLDSKLVPLADRITFVCFMLTNFKRNIIK